MQKWQLSVCVCVIGLLCSYEYHYAMPLFGGYDVLQAEPSVCVCSPAKAQVSQGLAAIGQKVTC